jgi:hypothetical protein
MVLYFLRTIKPKSVNRFSLNEFVEEVGSFQTPSSRDFLFSDLNLFGKDMVSDFLSVLPQIGSFAEHALVSNHPHREVVHCYSMVLTTHHLRS